MVCFPPPDRHILGRCASAPSGERGARGRLGPMVSGELPCPLAGVRGQRGAPSLLPILGAWGVRGDEGSPLLSVFSQGLVYVFRPTMRVPGVRCPRITPHNPKFAALFPGCCDGCFQPRNLPRQGNPPPIYSSLQGSVTAGMGVTGCAAVYIAPGPLLRGCCAGVWGWWTRMHGPEWCRKSPKMPATYSSGQCIHSRCSALLRAKSVSGFAVPGLVPDCPLQV